MRRMVLVLWLGLIQSGCVGTPTTDTHSLPIFLKAPIAATDVADKRSEFAWIFCAHVRADGHRCEDFLYDTGADGNPAGSALNVNKRVDPGAIVTLLIPGIFGECVASYATVFEDAGKSLAAQGFRVDLIATRGRGDSKHNAQLIADYVASYDLAADQKLMIVAHSKGVADTMEALVDHPDKMANVDALVAIAGVVNGSPLADDLPGLFRWLVNRFPYQPCPAQGQDAISSISYQYRSNWLAENTLPARVRYYSIAAIADAENVSRGLRVSYRRLSKLDNRNDGQLIYYDAILPGSQLLALVNSDHWAVTMPLRDRGMLSTLVANKNRFPRQALLRSVLEHVGADLGARQVPSAD